MLIPILSTVVAAKRTSSPEQKSVTTSNHIIVSYILLRTRLDAPCTPTRHLHSEKWALTLPAQTESTKYLQALRSRSRSSRPIRAHAQSMSDAELLHWTWVLAESAGAY